MRRFPTLLAGLLFLSYAAFAQPRIAQRITLHHLMGFHSMDDSLISRQLQQDGWHYHGVQQGVLRKPRMYSLATPVAPDAQLYLYSYHKKPLCKVELVSSDVESFNATIRDSLGAYGFMPDMEGQAPDEEKLKITSSAAFVNRDAIMPVHALILYFEERRCPKVSLTIYGDE